MNRPSFADIERAKFAIERAVDEDDLKQRVKEFYVKLLYSDLPLTEPIAI